LREQRRAAHHQARRTESALHGVVLDEGLLHRMQLVSIAETLDGRYRTLADIERDILKLARMVGREAAGERVIRRMRRELATIATRAKSLTHHRRVYCEAWPNPRISSPPWVAELVKISGGEMVVPPGQKITDEEVANAQPEVMVLAWAATGAKAKVDQAYKVAAWRDIPAIRNHRVYVVRDELLNTPGPPLIAGAKELARIFRAQAPHLRRR